MSDGASYEFSGLSDSTLLEIENEVNVLFGELGLLLPSKDSEESSSTCGLILLDHTKYFFLERFRFGLAYLFREINEAQGIEEQMDFCVEVVNTGTVHCTLG